MRRSWERGARGELTLGRIIADNTGDNTKQDAPMGHEEPRCRGSSNKPRNNTRAKTDHRPLLRESEVKQDPGNPRESRGQVRVPARHNGPQVRAKGGTTVEPKPSEPQQDRTESNERDVMGPEVEEHLLLALAENEGVSESAHTGGNFDGSTACDVLADDVPAISRGSLVERVFVR